MAMLLSGHRCARTWPGRIVAARPVWSADRWGVLDAALVPQRIDAAGDLQRRAVADVAVEDFAVVTERLDDVIGPVVAEADALAEGAVGAEQTLNVLVLRSLHL